MKKWFQQTVFKIYSRRLSALCFPITVGIYEHLSLVHSLEKACILKTHISFVLGLQNVDMVQYDTKAFLMVECKWIAKEVSYNCLDMG